VTVVEVAPELTLVTEEVVLLDPDETPGV